MYILGISCFYHDSAICLVRDGEIIFAAQEERFTRKKADSSFPKQAILACLRTCHLEINQIDHIIYYEKPFLKFERILENFLQYAPKGFKTFFKYLPIWINEKIRIKANLRKELKMLGLSREFQLHFSEHHLSHAASAYFASPFSDCVVLTVDGVGEWSTTSIFKAENKSITLLKQINYPHSLGLFYSSVTVFLGFKVNSGEYKVMGLAPYYKGNDDLVNEYVEKLKKYIIQINDDGSFYLNLKMFSFHHNDKMIPFEKWETLFLLKRRKPEDRIDYQHACLAQAAQLVLEEVLVKMARFAHQLYPSKNLCLAGGVALNCVANTKVELAEIFDNIWIQPAAGDAGGALGSALLLCHFLNPNIEKSKIDIMSSSLLGTEIDDDEVLDLRNLYSAQFQSYDELDLYLLIAQKLDQGKVVGWVQGKMEWGPRALGNRSILADSRKVDMINILNKKIKFREGFRPFAPILLQEELAKLYMFNIETPYMLKVNYIKEDLRLKIEYKNKLEELRDQEKCNISSVVHADYSSRIQTVTHENGRIWELLKCFKKLSGIGLLINTSFNVRGEPIVCDAQDAYKCFMNTDMDILVINHFVFFKEDQPDYNNKLKWKQYFEVD